MPSAFAADAGIEPIAETYAAAGQRVELAEGRTLNLRCSGKGEPVVLLEAGGNADSSTWYRVQRELADHTRVCAYDRAGYGFSDEGPMPRDLDANVTDLHALIQAANIPVPVLLVGHSLGSNIVRRYAQRHPQQVAGLVLVDPPEQGADSRMPEDWQQQIAAMLPQREALLTRCEEAAAQNDLETITQRCLRPQPAWMGERVAAAAVNNKSKPAYWRTLRSELASNIAVFAEPVPADESYGALPLVLLSAGTGDEDAPEEVLKVIAEAREQTHARILAASSRGSAIEVANAGHDIQLDQPTAVVQAVRGLLAELRGAAADTPAAE
jgi:pimeloyl-ACP methyl ester carboxylesterase